MLIITTLIILLGQKGFSQQSVDLFVDNTIKVDSLNVPTNLKQPYFPKKFFPETQTDWIKENNSTYKIESKVVEGTYDEFVVNWYSEHLYAMKEPLLFNKKTSKEIYRFTWLRTFHKPIAIRIEKENTDYTIFWKMLSGAGGYEPGELILEKSKTLSEKEWQNFINHLNKSNFWKMDLGRSSIGTDGSEWILEGVTPRQYQVITVWSPKKGNFYNVCNYLLSLTDLDISENEKY